LHRDAIERSRDEPLVEGMSVVIALVADCAQPRDER
jgi:hypothetical protein